MNILFLNHNPERYGTYFRCYHLGRHLADRGHNVTLVCASREATLRTTERKEGGLRIRFLPRVIVWRSEKMSDTSLCVNVQRGVLVCTL